MFEKILSDAKINKKIVSIYPDVDKTAKFNLGFIEDFSDDYVLLASISTNGKYDGYITVQRDDIFKIETDSEYIVYIETLYKIQEQSHSKKLPENTHILLKLLDFARENQSIVHVELCNSDLDNAIGFVSEIDDEILIHQITPFGEPNGSTYISLEHITSIFCDGEGDKLLEQVVKLGR